MAKKKVEQEGEIVGVNIDKEIISKYGESIILDASAVMDEAVQIIPVSPAIDIGLNGGIPEGSWFTLTGLAKRGKTTLALHFAAKCQLPEYGARPVFYINIEGRLKKMNLTGIKGLDISKMKIIGSTQGNILSAEDYLAIAETIASSIPNAVIIIDSYSALCTESETTKGMDEQQRADGQKLLAKFCRRMANVVPVNKTIIIGITHLMGNPTGYGGDREKGGYAIAYQADVKLKAGALEKITNKQGRQIGQKVEWSVEVSALGPPGAKIASTIRYGVGIDETAELIDLAVELGVIEQKGSWFNFNPDMIESTDEAFAQKSQGKDGLWDMLNNDRFVYEGVDKTIKKLLYSDKS